MPHGNGFIGTTFSKYFQCPYLSPWNCRLMQREAITYILLSRRQLHSPHPCLLSPRSGALQTQVLIRIEVQKNKPVLPMETPTSREYLDSMVGIFFLYAIVAEQSHTYFGGNSLKVHKADQIYNSFKALVESKQKPRFPFCQSLHQVSQ